MIRQLGVVMLGVMCCFNGGAAAAGRPALVDSLERQLRAELDCFYPRTLDEAGGGFVAGFGNDWTAAPAERQSKHVVFQARQTWTAAAVAMRRPALAGRFLPIARHGAAFLMNTMRDAENGGFYWELDRGGKPLAHAEKNAYGQAFAIYGLAAAGQATGDATYLDAAYGGFDWLEAHAHDAADGGYFEQFRRDGTPILDPRQSDRPGATRDLMDIPLGYKSMNAHIHLMEAFTQLYRARPTPRLRERLAELVAVVRDKIAVAPGCLNLVFTPDWRALPGHDSFGHDIETAVLLLEAAEAIGEGDDAQTRAVAKSLVDHTLAVGYDAEHGGVYEEGFAFGRPTSTTKIWWTQAETIHGLAFAVEQFGDADGRYSAALEQTWRFIVDHQIDAKNGGWYLGVPADGRVGPGGGDKSSNWKSSYHTARAMMNAADALRRADEKQTADDQ